MKKLLGILGAIAFTASLSSTVVACGSSKSKDSSSKLADTLTWPDSADDTVIKLSDGTLIKGKDFLNKAQLDSYLLNELNQLVGNDYARDYNQTNVVSGSNTNLGLLDANRNLKLQDPTNKDINAYADEISNFDFTSLATSFFQQYVNSLNNDVTPFDQTAYWSSTYLNPTRYGTDTNSRAYSLWFSSDGTNYTRWTTDAETAGLSTGIKYIPKANELTNGGFLLVKNLNGKFPTGDNDNKLTEADLATKTKDELNDGKAFKTVEDNITGQKALTYRFQSYLQSQNDSSMINALTMEYEKNTMYKLQKAPSVNATAYEKAVNKSLYVDTSSTFAKAVQSWPVGDNDAITSNYKMIWTVTVTADQAKTINSTLNDGNLVDPTATGLSSNDYSVFSNKVAGIKNLYKQLKVDDADNKNLAKKGTDPLFGQSGYQGIVKDGKVVDGGSLDISSNASDKIKKAEGFGILKNSTTTAGTGDYSFNSAKGTTKDFVIVMPVYLMDLLRSADETHNTSLVPNTTPNTVSNLATNQWIELNPQVSADKWTSKSQFTGWTNATEWKPSDDKKDALPTDNEYMTVDGKTYVFIGNTSNDITVKADGTTITISGHKTTDDDKITSGYGIGGTFINPDKTGDKDSQAINGQSVNYQIHLGSDSSNPTSYQDNWTSVHKEQNVSDIANLPLNKKEDLMNNLMAIVAKNDSSIQEETKNAIYRNYISLDDIYYKGLYDQISKYLKADDKIDPTD